MRLVTVVKAELKTVVVLKPAAVLKPTIGWVESYGTAKDTFR